MNKLDECEALARELRLNGTLVDIQTRRKIAELVGIKFMVTTRDLVREKILSCFWWRRGSWQSLVPAVIGIPVGFFLSLLSVANFPRESETGFTIFFCGVLLTGLSLCVSVYAPPDIRIRSSPLASWDHGLPYGALLAVKEAKEAGLNSFVIWYPVDRIKDDPIITGYDEAGQMREVFAWDDGKVYE